MPWTTSYLPDLKAVLTVYSGLITLPELRAAAAATIALARQNGTDRLLGDCVGLEGGHSIVDLYGLGQLIESIPGATGIHEALVLPQLAAAARDVQFWETTCRNRGIDVRVFRTMEEARSWLIERTAAARA